MTALAITQVELHWEGWNGFGLGSLACIGIAMAIVALLDKAGRARARVDQRGRDRLITTQANISTPSSLATEERRIQNKLPTAAFFQPVIKWGRGLRYRVWPRWAGNPTPVLLRLEETNTDPEQATVLNRSRGGVLLLAPQPAAVRSKLAVCRSDLKNGDSWIQIEVRHCRRTSRGHLLGCAFMSGDPELLLN